MNPSYTLTVVMPIVDLGHSRSALIEYSSPHVKAAVAAIAASWTGEPQWRVASGTDIDGWDAFTSVLVAEVPIRINPVALSLRKEERIRMLAADGYSDREISAVVGIKPASVLRYRKRHGIPAGVARKGGQR